MMAGIIKLIIHNINIDDKIPTTLLENNPNTNKATEPLTPISANAIVGVIVIKKNTNITENTASYKPISTPNRLSKIKN
jgi:hypothetical protein